MEDLSELEFLTDKNESLKNIVINSFTAGVDKEAINLKIKKSFREIIEEVNENSNIQIISKDKTNKEIEDLLNELITDYKEQGNLKKIESLEKKLINNLDENSYSELIKLKSQLNRD